MNESWPEVCYRGTALARAKIEPAEVHALLREIIDSLVGESLPVVERVVVADFDLYHNAIVEVTGCDPSAVTHTNRGDYLGIAKAIPRYDNENERVSTTLVFRAGVIASALGRQDVEPIMEVGLGRYIVTHEVAHCLDYCLRRTGAQPVTSTECWLARCGELNKRVLLDEYVACVLAGKTLDDATLQQLSSLDGDVLEDEIQATLLKRMQFRMRLSTNLEELAYAVAGLGWFILIQYAKSIGHIFGAGRTSEHVAVPPALAKTAAAMLDDLATCLNGIWACYPNIPQETFSELDRIWLGLTTSLGFRFERTPDGPALWLD